MVQITRLLIPTIVLGLFLAACDVMTSSDDATTANRADNTYQPSTIVDDGEDDNSDDSEDDGSDDSDDDSQNDTEDDGDDDEDGGDDDGEDSEDETDTVRGGEGCTPGAWKNRLLRLDRWPVAPDTPVANVWNVPAALEDATLLDALRFGGGPSFEDKVRILLRAATAAYLNARSIDYDLTADTIVDRVNDAIASGDADAVIALAEELDGLNNQDCPITERDYEG